MFDLLKPKFYGKCKSAIKMINVRLETIKRKRNAVEKYLKSDIVELLKSGLDYNAYGRAEGLLAEKNRTECYNLIEQFTDCISKHLSIMQKQSECPEECREAIPSLVYAAARLADLPELRDLRTLFTEKYGNSLESFINQEFVQKLRVEPPRKEMKLQLLHDIAQEASIEWDSKALEQKLFDPLEHEESRTRFKDNADDVGFRNMQNNSMPKRNETELTFRGRKEDTDDAHSSSEDEVTDQDMPKATTNTSVGSVSDDSIQNRKPFYYRFVPPPPYVKPSLDKEKSRTDEAKTPSESTDDKPKPRSVRRRPSSVVNRKDEVNPRDEEEKVMDGLLMFYSKKKSPYDLGSKWKPNLTGRKTAAEGSNGGLKFQTAKSDPGTPSDIAASFPKEDQTTIRHGRGNSLQPDMFAGHGHGHGHVHPKLPEYDDLAARLAALRGV